MKDSSCFTSCPCGTGKGYAACCGPLHSGNAFAPTAEVLMRSRYSAYACNQVGYLLATWHVRTRPATLFPHEPGTRWLGLQIRAQTQQDADHATVAFVALSKLHGRAHRLQEISRFVRDDGRWYYLDGDVT